MYKILPFVPHLRKHENVKNATVYQQVIRLIITRLREAALSSNMSRTLPTNLET